MFKPRQALILGSASSSPTCAGYGTGALLRKSVTSANIEIQAAVEAWSEIPMGNRTTLTQL
eukprot:4706022-Amphidinium_carterae.1